MKRLILLLIAVVFVSCGSSKTLRDSKKVIKGNWTLNTITYSSAGTYKVNLLNDASKECFEGSTWQFTPNNNTGMYAINDSGCSAGARHFVFTIQEINADSGVYNFLLKPTNEKHKSETNEGFRLKLAALSGTMMQLEQTVTVDELPFTITMNFTKA